MINIRIDANIGQAGGYLWAKTYSSSFSYDLSFAINPSGKFYYGIKDSSWSSANSFSLGGNSSSGNRPKGCKTIFENGPADKKINIYYYEDGFNQKPEVYDDFVKKTVAATFGTENFPGVEPFESLKKEFNVYSYEDLQNSDDGNCWPPTEKCQRNQIIKNLKENCQGFSATSDFGSSDGNYNIIVLPFDENGWGSSSRSMKWLNSTTLRLASADIIYHSNHNQIALIHEFGHVIGFFDEEYFYYDPYLGAKTFSPNVDSFSCTKWCQGFNKKSECYDKYVQWLECFKNKFIDTSSEIQNILTQNNLNYKDSKDYGWWGTCFNGKNINICGGKIAYIVDSRIRPENGQPDQQWIDNWEYCKNKYPNVAGSQACDLGLNCGGNGCFAAGSFSKFIPSRENEFMMGFDYADTRKFNKHDEKILRNNILNKVRFIDVETLEGGD